MSSDRFPAPPHLPSIPKLSARESELAETQPPEDADALRLMRDVRGACVNLGEKIEKLEVYLMRQELAILTEEAKTHHAHERLDHQAREFAALVERVMALESIAPKAAE